MAHRMERNRLVVRVKETLDPTHNQSVSSVALI